VPRPAEAGAAYVPEATRRASSSVQALRSVRGRTRILRRRIHRIVMRPEDGRKSGAVRRRQMKNEKNEREVMS
jgi:hypothetical protein